MITILNLPYGGRNPSELVYDKDVLNIKNKGSKGKI